MHQDHYPPEEQAERNRILIELDIPAARRLIGGNSIGLSDEGILWGLHKTRLHVPTVPRQLRQQSLDLLRANGFSDLHGQPLPDRIDE